MAAVIAKGARGFTLIELMIVMVVVALLAAVAYPSYLESVRKSRRTEAKNSLLDLAARQERYFTTHNAFAATPVALGYDAPAFPIAVRYGENAHYLLDMRVHAGSTGWSASAAPVGGQTADRCGTYLIDDLGTQSNSGHMVATTTCW